MAIAKARSADPVRGYYVTTIHTGRVTQRSGFGFGAARLGGLAYARVDGLTSGGTGAGRMLTSRPDMTARQIELQKAQAVEEEKARVADHEEFRKSRTEAAKKDAEAVKKGEEMQKKMQEDAKKAADKPKHEESKVEIVKDPVTGVNRVTGKDHATPEDLDDPVQIAKAEKKTVGEQKAEAASENPPVVVSPVPPVKK